MQITFEAPSPPSMNIEFLENRTLCANITTNSTDDEFSRGGSGSNSYSDNPNNNSNEWGVLGGMLAGSIEGGVFTNYMIASTQASILPEKKEKLLL